MHRTHYHPHPARLPRKNRDQAETGHQYQQSASSQGLAPSRFVQSYECRELLRYPLGDRIHRPDIRPDPDAGASFGRNPGSTIRGRLGGQVVNTHFCPKDCSACNEPRERCCTCTKWRCTNLDCDKWMHDCKNSSGFTLCAPKEKIRN